MRLYLQELQFSLEVGTLEIVYGEVKEEEISVRVRKGLLQTYKVQAEAPGTRGYTLTFSQTSSAGAGKLTGFSTRKQHTQNHPGVVHP